jgi:hypothetical protein
MPEGPKQEGANSESNSSPAKFVGLVPTHIYRLVLTHRDELTLYTMPPKPRFLCMDKDDVVWQKLDEATDEWYKSIRTNEIYRAVSNLILQHRNCQPEVMHTVVKGGYNIIYRLEYSDGSSVIMRIPIKGMPRAL